MSRENQKVPGIEESQYFLSFEARFHKLGFAVLLIIISLAVLGVFSDGYFSNAMSKNTTGEVTLNFERFGRLQTEFKLKISATDQHSEGGIYRIGGDFNAFYETKNIWPLPDRMYSKGDDLYLVYNTNKNQENMAIWLLVTPVKPGSTTSVLQLNSGPEIRFNQFIYP
ncbi:TPA: hypothetical protein I8385_001875 [Citrobacter freundii]|uniref:Uncharacterized protein n=2 Tax=Enterobacteriaceae TaxID=543 RepID=A0ABD6M423_9ENTR|nr:hypothetical protein [Citrobacter braakii]MBA7729784.1 hypothetical protein [Citrobacter freundii]MBP5852390.1 hypothetical protein [Citrobacter sp. AN-PRR1]NTZ51320.1 hypothetical protein [Citrobacter gillenii]PAX78081.1 hypothetical protein CIK43_19820 [Citrobacter sp. TSA-1]HDT2080076.1 hypothetical protein [Enterobacter roggenkampii]